DAVQPTPGGPTGGDIFTGDTYVTKLNTRGSGLIYSTYLGGSNGEFSQGIALDILGNAYVTGITASSDFPTTPGAFQREFKGPATPILGGDAYITKIGRQFRFNNDERFNNNEDR